VTDDRQTDRPRFAEKCEATGGIASAVRAIPPKTTDYRLLQTVGYYNYY